MLLTPADVVILAVLGLSVLFGILRGFVSEVLSLLGWVAAFWVAWAFGAKAAGFFATWLRDPTACLIAGYVGCFVGVVVLGAIIGWAVRKLMDGGGLRGGDRFLGMLFGFARGVVLVTFAVFLLDFTAVPRTAPWWHQSLLLPAFQDAAGWFGGKLPADVTQRVEAGRKALPTLPGIPISGLPQALDPATAGTAAPLAHRATGRAVGHGSTRGDVGQ